MTNYQRFHELHHRELPFILGNVWNGKSAQLMQQNGYEAIGTSSGAIAHSLGYEDGEKIPFSELLFIVNRITASVRIPVSVDLERGYTNDLEQLIAHIQQLIDVGVVGINIEDAQGENTFLRKLNAIKRYLVTSNQSFFINARTDGFLQKLDDPLNLTIQRARRYQEAGADGLFVTALSEASFIREIASSTALPLNIVGSPRLSSVKELADCGVKRISMAVLLFKAAYNQVGALARQVSDLQSFEPLY